MRPPGKVFRGDQGQCLVRRILRRQSYAQMAGFVNRGRGPIVGSKNAGWPPHSPEMVGSCAAAIRVFFKSERNPERTLPPGSMIFGDADAHFWEQGAG